MRRTMVILALALLLAVPYVSPVTYAEPDVGDTLLVDYGNGTATWYPMTTSGGTLLSAVEDVLDINSVPCTDDGTSLTSVGGVYNRIVGTQECSWRFYIWDSYAWIYGATDGSEKYAGGTLAVAYYPTEDILPVSTPFYTGSWTSFRGDSSGSAVSGSYGPVEAATPLEWSLNVSTGGIYSSILAADGLVYYITGGDYYGTGVNRNPHLYCVDTVNHEVAWKFGYSISQSAGSSEYELNTPVVIGDMIVVTSSNRHVFCLDRYEGKVLAEMVPEGEKAQYAGVFNTFEYAYGTVSGAVSSKGAGTAVYDSGALYFTTSDGVLHAVSVMHSGGSAVFDELWRYPSSGSGTCSAAPSVMELGDRKVIVTAGNNGTIMCLDQKDGSLVSSFDVELGVYGLCKVIPAGNRKVIAMADDGAMIPLNGCTVAVDLGNASVLWKADVFPYMHSVPTIVGNTIYTYLEPSVSGTGAQLPDKNGNMTDAEPGYYALSLDDGHWIWKKPSDARTRSGMTYCDGRLYCVDYSTLAEWPVGGAARCLDAETGDIVWSVRLEPGSNTAYNMCAPTVLDGKVYVGNDDGTLYCISDIPGKERHSTSDADYESEGLAHWSWLLLFSVATLTAVVAVIMYRK
ncbi:MAG: PQQ-binding-like beta-propeller repeat protein [archaeon]|nr:PQQ-binding-like beta-propeller repeat protein [archaeon]